MATKLGRCRGCPDPRLCRRLGMHVTGRLWDIWQGEAEGLTAEQCALYRDQWQGCRPGPFDRVVLLTLRRRQDRLTAALRQLVKDRWPFQMPEVFFGVDGSLVPTPPGFSQGGGAWGCLSSHRRILELALQDGVQNLLVLEDDFLLRRGFMSDVQSFLNRVPADYEGLMLGGQHQWPAVPVGPGVVRCMDTERTHCYSCRGEWMRELYRCWHCPSASVHCDWLMGPMMKRFKVYAPDPFLIGQRRTPSDITGRESPANFWHPPQGTEAVIVLDAPAKALPALRDQGWHTGFQRDPVTDRDVGLEAVAAGNLPLRTWLDQLMWEVVQEEGWVLCVWHPQITADQVRAVWPGPVLEIRAHCATAAVQIYKVWLTSQAPSQSA